MKTNTRRMVETALMLAIGTVLSVLSFQGVWALGGASHFVPCCPWWSCPGAGAGSGACCPLSYSVCCN
jgi:hypothetical protein